MSETVEGRLSLQLRNVMAAVDDPTRGEELRTLFTPEARFRLGNVAPVVGREAIYADLGVSLHEHMPRMRHELVTTWETHPTVFAEGLVHYWPDGTDGSHVALPLLLRAHFSDDGLVSDLLAMMDRSASHPFRHEVEALEA